MCVCVSVCACACVCRGGTAAVVNVCKGGGQWTNNVMPATYYALVEAANYIFSCVQQVVVAAAAAAAVIAAAAAAVMAMAAGVS